jgi:hypothetical protein
MQEGKQMRDKKTELIFIFQNQKVVLERSKSALTESRQLLVASSKMKSGNPTMTTLSGAGPPISM